MLPETNRAKRRGRLYMEALPVAVVDSPHENDNDAN